MNLNEIPVPDYEADYALWLEYQLLALGQHQFANLDIENLLEEIGGILRSERRELRSRLRVIMLHLLKCQFQPELKGSSWSNTLRAQRRELAELLRDSPSLQRYVPKFAKDTYQWALNDAAEETGLPATTFPAELPYSHAELLDVDFVP